MKNLKAPFLVIALLLLNVSVALSQGGNSNETPVPGNSGLDEMEDDPGCDEPPCGGQPPDFPIDQNISFLLASGVALGAIAIHKNQTKKASI
ncbi:hypothetical protein [Flavobacterium luteolum]|uniref:hypothetical protein n=1 Tax=Flavobacterium luteolum TaxID=3003259 RepID=UPI00248DF725|nr:hypothetical protein [Flavobacterium luteolum]